MAKSVIVLSFLLTGYCQGSPLPHKDGLLQYHENMTSMWMVDDYGRLRQIQLTAKPQHSQRPLVNVQDHVYYFLYTRKYNSAYQLIRGDTTRLKYSTFNPERPTKVVVHGFWSNYQSDAVQVIREAYLNAGSDVNVIGVDWSYLSAGPWYLEAASNTEPVGQQIALMIDFLVSTTGVDVSNIHLLGHSLGAHVSAFAANKVTSGRITRITGLDPALPLFSSRPPESRLDPTDADLVDCIHTCGGYLGFWQPLCSLDFYPNGGTASQPGCHWDLLGACSHGRSYRYYSVSVTSQFVARACASLDEVQRGRCSGHVGVMGDPAPTTKPGLYYLETTSDYPYTV
ncbi:pancreatic triacylglycerol lipase-like [Macrosteles quadrilineatus]|uniref:pancreatic triacylglycerol lipase-like n=1 Tax=Macrosteles quadrilineatus TaxID=74068 RepID=UPI0023E32047|nr:pancreatic triacylglycerol lipase-like [Macrosteles quadrilineatus]